jgi:CelD/BcsL family acetyltransferase involved in cellulose biosynthesis
MREQFEVTRSIGNASALQAFDADWDAMAGADPDATIFQTGCWYRAWVDAVAAAEAQLPIVLRWRKQGRLVLGLALQLGRDGHGRRVLSALGSPWADYDEAVGGVADPAVLAAVADETGRLAAEFDATLRFSDVRTAGTLAQILSRLPVVQRPSTPTVAIDLSDRECLARLADNREYRIKRRRLDRLGALQLRHHRDAGAIGERLSDFIALHLAQWRHRADAVAPFDSATVRDGFRAIARSTAQCGHMLLTELTLGRTLLAGYFGFVYRNSYYAYRTAYDRAWFRYSPGHLMLRGMLEDFARAGITRFDLMRGAYGYKTVYASQITLNTAFETCAAVELGPAWPRAPQALLGPVVRVPHPERGAER